MTSLRASLLTLSIVSALSLGGAAHSQSNGPTAAQDAQEKEQEIAAAREDLNRAAKRLAELSGQHRGQGFMFDRALPVRPVVGVLLAPEPQGGVRIAGVTPDGAAAGAGLKSGDRLLRISGKAIAGATPEARVESVRALLQGVNEKTAIKLAYARDGREAEVSVTPKLDQRVMVFVGDGQAPRPGGNMQGGNMIVRRIGDGGMRIDSEDIDIESHMGAPRHGAAGDAHVFTFNSEGAGTSIEGRPIIDKRVIRIDCKGDETTCRDKANAQMLMVPNGGDGEIHRITLRSDCKPGESCTGQRRLAEAFRWNGLNLASVDAQLGRYFGTDTGVLVLSTGPALGQLQAGDVIRRVDGKVVETPRAVMDALRDKPADSTVAVEYLRDRVSANTQLKVPKAMAFPMAPPAPPAPPARPAPPHPPKAGVAPLTHRRIVMVDKDGQVQTWEDDGNSAVPVPPAPPAPPVPPPAPRVD